MKTEDIVNGVSEGFLTAFEHLQLSRNDMQDIIRAGISDGLFAVATNGTSMPTADFLDTVKDAVKEWMNDHELDIIEGLKP